MFAVSYLIILTFYPNLYLDEIIIKRSISYDLQKQLNVGYLKLGQLSFADSTTILQL